MIERTPVSSSNVKSVGYSPDDKTMAVEFSDGSVYHYHDVEKDAHDSLVNAKSVGKHLHEQIRGKYSHSKQ